MTKPKPKPQAILKGDDDEAPAVNTAADMPAGGVRSERDPDEPEFGNTPGLICATSIYQETNGHYFVNFSDDKRAKFKTRKEAYAALMKFYKEVLDIE